MEVSYDPAKHAKTLEERGLDFEDVPAVFAGPSLTQCDDRFDYGEERYQTYRLLDDRWRWSFGRERRIGRALFR